MSFRVFKGEIKDQIKIIRFAINKHREIFLTYFLEDIISMNKLNGFKKYSKE